MVLPVYIIVPCLPGSERVPVLVSTGFPRPLIGKESACQCREHVQVPVLGGSPEKEMETHSGMLAWRATIYGVTKNQALVSD